MKKQKNTRKPKILSVAQLGDPVLRKKAKPVKDIKDPYIQELIDDLIETCRDADGVGIAAPQVYEPVRIFIVWSRPNDRYPDAPLTEPVAMINPRIVSRSKEKKKAYEGCLSIPGIRALVPRHIKVAIEYTDRKGKEVRKSLNHEFVARVFQHELDHLDGIVFLDRAKSSDMITEKQYKVLMKKTSVVKAKKVRINKR